MRLLKIRGAQFKRVAYTGPQSLLTVDTGRGTFPIRLWNLAQDAPPTELSPQQRDFTWTVFRPGGADFLRAQGAWPESEPIPLVEHAPRIKALLATEGRPGQPCAFGPDGATVLFSYTGFTDGAYRTRFHVKLPDGTVHDLYRARSLLTTTAAISPSSRLAAMTNGMRDVAVWDVTAPRELFVLEQSDTVGAVAFASDQRLVVAAGRSVRLWDVADGRSLSKFRAFRKFADALAVSPDRKLFAAGSRDGLVRIWDTASGREVKAYEWGIGEVRELAFSPDGATAAAAGVSAVAVWDLD
jgi:WD40 repeat protein